MHKNTGNILTVLKKLVKKNFTRSLTVTDIKENKYFTKFFDLAEGRGNDSIMLKQSFLLFCLVLCVLALICVCSLCLTFARFVLYAVTLL